MDISRFLNHLARYSGENTFNPWADHDENYEIEKALAIRRAAPGFFSWPKPAAIRAAIFPASP